jgi:16S rRNA (cytosine967-C5)-methyltransferase
MVRRWVPRFGFEETKKLLIAANERPHLSLRINRLKIEPGLFLRQLEAQGIAYTGSSHIDYFVRVKALAGIGQMELFRNGMFTVQDESAALPTILLAPAPGDRVYDLCAAPGGKTTNIAEIMKNEGEVIAFDRHEAKLGLIRASCERLGLRNVTLRVGDASALEADPADRVLLDAPCSGLGVLAKKPDMKWKRDIADILKLTKIQAGLLDNAARLVKPDGVLVYSTCTIEPEENEMMVDAFLARHPEFRLDDAAQYVSRDLVNARGFVETFPHRHGMDGSFAARLVRSSHP